MQFDATLKSLLESGPADWPRLLGHAADDVEVIDADISTVSGAADKVLRIKSPKPFILHLEFQVGPDAVKPRKLNLYNAVLEDRTGLPVKTAFILLRPKAYLRAYDGKYQRNLPDEVEPYRTFRYDVVRVWELPPKLLLGGLGTLPLAPISALDRGELPGLLEEMNVRMRRQSTTVVEQVWASALILMGLKYDRVLIDRLLQEALGMEESVTYQLLLEKGAVREARKILLRQGELRFGVAAPAKSLAALNKIEEIEALERLSERVLTAESWEELLRLPPRKSRKRS